MSLVSKKLKCCKICGTTKSEDFGPRKSVICKKCDKTSDVITSEVVIPEVVIPESKNDDNSGNFKHTMYEEIEMLKIEVEKIKNELYMFQKIKKMFPKLFPEI